MSALGSNNHTYKVSGSVPSGVTVSIRLDLSFSRYSLGQRINAAAIDGNTSPSIVTAEKSAVMNAIKYLNEKHLIKIKDFSSTVAQELDSSSTLGYVNAALYNVESLLDQWEIVMEKCQSITKKLGLKTATSIADVDCNGQLETFNSLLKFMEMTTEMFQVHVSSARSKATNIENQRKSYHERCTEKYHAIQAKGHQHVVSVCPKDVLDYVLMYIGSGKAIYTNCPVDDCYMDCSIMFNIPDRLGIEACGNLTLKGKGKGSREAEQNVAFHALMCMEKTYKLKIVDLNFDERVEVENDQKLLVGFMEDLVHLGDDVQNY